MFIYFPVKFAFTNDTPYLTLSREPWGVFGELYKEKFGRNLALLERKSSVLHVRQLIRKTQHDIMFPLYRKYLIQGASTTKT